MDAAALPGGKFAGMRQLLNDDPQAFVEAAMPVISGPVTAAGRHYLISLLISRGLAPPCDPAIASLKDEIAIARAVVTQDSHLEGRLARRLVECLNREPTDDQRAERILGIIAAVSDPAHAESALHSFLTHDNVRLRSKAVLLHARESRDPKLVAALLEEPNPRVRANAVEGLWGVDTPEARALLQRAAGDRNNRVAGNALLGLLRLDDRDAAARTRELTKSADAPLRATAAWVMGASGMTGFVGDLARMIRDPDSRVRHSVFRAISRLRPQMP